MLQVQWQQQQAAVSELQAAHHALQQQADAVQQQLRAELDSTHRASEQQQLLLQCTQQRLANARHQLGSAVINRWRGNSMLSAWGAWRRLASHGAATRQLQSVLGEHQQRAAQAQGSLQQRMEQLHVELQSAHTQEHSSSEQCGCHRRGRRSTAVSLLCSCSSAAAVILWRSAPAWLS